MKVLKTILAAVDFTPSCQNAVREAVRRASLDQAKLVVVHVMDEFLVHELKRALSTDQASIRAEWEEKLKAFVSEAAPAAGVVETEVRIGHAFTELVMACQVHEADLLVMGVKGSRDEPHRVGVIAAKCVRKAPVDVLLVREDARSPFRHLVACEDFSENSAKAIQAAVHLARQDGAVLDCLHVYQSALALSLDYGGLAAPMPLEIDPETLNVWKKELQQRVDSLQAEFPDVKINGEVKERVNIRDAILEHVTEIQADLVVLGTRGKNGLRELLIGTTAEKIVSHAACSILAVKPEGFVSPVL